MGRLKNPNIKRANAEHEYTIEQISELDRCMNDPVYFIQTYCRIQHPVRGAIPFDLYDYQIDMIRAYVEKKDVAVLSARQTGKEQPHSAKIATPTGWTTMGDILPGDTILTPSGNTSCVLDKFQQGVKDVYKITFDDGSHAESGIDHLWTVYTRDKWERSAANGHGGYVVREQTITLRDIIKYRELQLQRKNANNYNVRVPVVQRVDFQEKKLPVDPYLLGLLLGDGCLSGGSICLTSKDTDIIESARAVLRPLKSIITARRSGNGLDHFITTPNSRKNLLLDTLRDLNLMGTKSDTKFIPDIYKTSSHEQRLALLQGLMDTDGTVGKRGNARTISYCTTSQQLRDDVQQLVWSLGGKCSYYTRYPQNKKHKVAYDLYISLPNPKNCFRLKRKYDLCHEVWHNNVGHEKAIRRTIVDIELVRREESSCILIDDPAHLYITDNFTVTHNSTISSMYLLWFAMFHDTKTVLIASNRNKGAMEMISRIQYAYQFIPAWLKPGITDDGWNKHTIKFDNESSIDSEATTESSGRGASISLLYLDEFAFVPNNIAEEFWTAITPTLSTGGDCIMSSTPNGDSNIFAQIWRGAQVDANGFYPIEVKWDQPPGRDEAFKEKQINKIGERRWRQEYECEFLSSDALLIDSLVLINLTKAIQDITPSYRMRDVIFWKKPEKDRTYLVGVDPATGSGEDFTVFEVVEFPAMKQIAEFRSNTMSSAEAYVILKNLLKYLQSVGGTTIYFSIENNGVGEGMIALYEADEKPPERAEFVSETGKSRYGMTTTGKSKMRACLNLKEMIEKNTLKIVSPILLQELKEYTRKSGSYDHRPGSTSDCISAMLIVMRLLLEIGTYEQDAFDKLHSFEDDEWTDDDYSEDSSPLPIAF